MSEFYEYIKSRYLNRYMTVLVKKKQLSYMISAI
jgi:hypothetical protein